MSLDTKQAYTSAYTTRVQQQQRLGGVLLHPTSLPSGKLDEDAFRWLDFMADAGLQVWQFLPLGVPQQNHSPYQCYSAFAINPTLLSDDVYNYAQADLTHTDFQQWFAKERHWLEDYALFIILKQHSNQQAWFQWPEPYKYRDPEVLKAFSLQYKKQCEQIYWQQYCLYQRWYVLRQYAQERHILLFGDMPIFIAHDSADIWVNPEAFLLDEQGQPTVVAGVPPDYFSETGQRWGNPHYNWEAMQQDNFCWWLNRLHNHLSLFDLVRIDHFRGLEAVWVIQADCETAIDGEWQKVPGDILLQYLHDEMGEIPIVAEDLGIITPEVNALRKKYHLPGMSVLQFAFDHFDDNPHKPKNIGYDRIVYTGTHDNDTTLGWFNSLDQAMQDFVMANLSVSDPNLVVDTLVQNAFESAGQLAVVPLQDLLSLGSEARMNIPGVSDGNWRWQFDWSMITPEITQKTRQILEKAGRLNT